MKRATSIASALLAMLLSLTALVRIAAAVETAPSLMSREDYDTLREQARADTRRSLAHCRTVEAPGRGMCRARAHAAERVAFAEAQARYRGTIAAHEEARRVKARAAEQLATAQRWAAS